MRILRTIIGLSLVALLAGCVVVVSPFGRSDNSLKETTVQGDGDARILWLPISGFISDSPGQNLFGLLNQPSTLARVTQALDKAEDDDDIAALVLRINSPGGTVAASDAIHARIKRYHADTGVPVLASMGGIAASGGYYVAMAADTVIAEPTTITGSIGVILAGVNITGLLDKLGIENQTFTSGDHKDILSPLRPARPGENAIAQQVVDALYNQFVSVVENSRGDALDQSRIHQITDGRIFAATTARERGLVDEIGRIDDVLAEARRQAGVESARVIRYYRGNTAPATIVADASVTSRPGAAARQPVGRAHATTAQPLYLWRAGAPW